MLRLELSSNELLVTPGAKSPLIRLNLSSLFLHWGLGMSIKIRIPVPYRNHNGTKPEPYRYRTEATPNPVIRYDAAQLSHLGLSEDQTCSDTMLNDRKPRETSDIQEEGRAHGFSPILKCTSTIRQLAYGTSPDAFDEYFQCAEHCSRECLWNFTKRIHMIADFMHHHNGKFILFGDMNVFHNENERFGSIFSQIEADHFNSFIELTGLIDLPIGVRLYTWMNKAGTKLSKLDRFLISDEVLEILPDICITALDRLCLGFGNKWRFWIRAYLHSSRASVLVNGSPTSEFSIKQVSSNLIHGINLSSPNLTLSHLFYADDVIITTEWNPVFDDEVSNMDRNSGCAAGSFPFTYLRLPIGSTMNRISTWKTLIDRFQSRLSFWKASLLSIGGRLTLIKAYLSIFKASGIILKS
ncbi:putative RNA-directed DNA polymerase, eukaryota, reverse transcriptase zinc-binding domain protein [Tanacetum coccineum]